MSCKKNKLNRKMKNIFINALKQREQLLLYGEIFTDEKGNVIPIEEWDKYKREDTFVKEYKGMMKNE